MVRRIDRTDDSGSLRNSLVIDPLIQKNDTTSTGGNVTKHNEPEVVPKSVYLIMGNEICERFSFYGLKAVLTLYLTTFLLYSPNDATSIVHGFIFVAYFTPLLGGYLADAHLGKFHTIISLSIVYIIGGCVLSFTAHPQIAGPEGDRSPLGMYLGLGLIAIGTGGIKPCVSSFLGEQFNEDNPALQTIFQVFYWCINLGSFVSTVSTPILRTKFAFWLAFGVPAVLLCIALLVFLAGSPSYKKKPPRGSIITTSARLVFTAAWLSITESGSRPPILLGEVSPHWLNRAASEDNQQLIRDLKIVFGVLLCFLPLPFFWSLFDQTGTRWTLQATLMNPMVFGYEIEPDQVQALNALMVMIFVPIFEYGLYRPLRKTGRAIPPLVKMSIGMWLSVAAFGMTIFVEISIQNNAAKSVSILWQVPQYVLLTWAEILISITGLEFAFTQAPDSMKGIIMSTWLLTVAFGNLFVLLVVDLVTLDQQWQEFLLFACVMSFFTLVFMFIAKRYKYRVINTKSSIEDERTSLLE